MIKVTPDVVYTAAIILFGAVVHATAQLQTARKTGLDFTWVDFVVLTVIAGFAGLIAGLLSTVFIENQVLIYVSSGIGGFLGINGLNILANTFLEFLAGKVKK